METTGSHSLPQPPECCDACLAREQIRCRILELESRLAKLKEEERETICRINTRHDPLQKMPIEVVSFIFEQTLDDDRSKYVTMPPFGPQDIGQVCRYWREVAWSTSSLWNKPTITLNGFGKYEEIQVQVDEEVDNKFFDKQFEQFQNCISRSGSLPLFVFILDNKYRDDIIVSTSDIEKVIKYLQEPDISNRIVHLHLDLPLHDLQITNFNGIRITSLKVVTRQVELECNLFDVDVQLMADLAANLETLTVASEELVKHLADIPFPKLTNLEVSDYPIEISDLIQLMRCTPTLKRCCCEVGVNSVPPGMDTMSSPTVLQHLRHLEIDLPWIFNASSLFDSFALPALQYLDIQDGNVDASSIISLFKRSQCRLQTFKFTGRANWTIADLESLLASLPKHPFLSFGPIFESATTISEILRTVLASSTTSRTECDVVSTFDCIIPLEPSDNWNFIPELFGRTSHTRDKRPMDIKLNLHRKKFDSRMLYQWISVEALGVIQELKERGWRWSVDMYVCGDWVSNYVDASAKYYEELAEV